MPEESFDITIDGQSVKAKAGQTVLQAAIAAGLHIPYLCYHEGLVPYGACRMCVVKVDGGRGAPASCTLPVQEGMVVHTSDEEVTSVRENIMDLLLAEHPHGCLTCHRVDLCGPSDICLRHVSVNDRCITCPKNERCELKDTARHVQMDLNSPLEYKYRDLQIETKDPFYDRDYNLCIVCGRCVRVCEEIRGDNAIGFTERAGQALVGTSRGTSLLESGCEFCGACLDVCPVGALVETDYKWDKPQEVKSAVCTNCSVGCQMNYEVNKRGKIIRAIPEIYSIVNQGQACYKGKFGFKYVNSKDRIVQPLIRVKGELQEVSWEDAISAAAEKLSKFKGQPYAALTSPRGTNEDQYIFQKFTREVMQSKSIDHSSNLTPALGEGLNRILGNNAGTNPVWDLVFAKTILVFNANITEDHNVLALPIKKAIKDGAKLVVIDPREIELTRSADIWIRPVPGTEPYVLAAVLRLVHEKLISQNKPVSEILGYEEFLKSIQEVDINDVVELTKVPAMQLQALAEAYADRSSPASVLYAFDNITLSNQIVCDEYIADLVLLSGQIGQSGSGVFPLRSGANDQGAIDIKSGFSDTASSEETTGQKFTLLNVFEQAQKRNVKALHIAGDHINFSNGKIDQVTEGLESLDLLIVHDFTLSPLAAKADIVFPSAPFSEKTGTYTNLERRVQLTDPVVEAPKTSIPSEWQILVSIAKQMGHAKFSYDSAEQVFDEISNANPLYKGIKHSELRATYQDIAKPDDSLPVPTQMQYTGKVRNGIIWPYDQTTQSSEAILYVDNALATKPQLAALRSVAESNLTSKEFPLIFVPGRTLRLDEDQTEVDRSGTHNTVNRTEFIDMNPVDAKQLDLKAGDEVNVAYNGHSLDATLRLMDSIHTGTISSTSLFGELAVELDASSEFDVMNKVPGLVVAPAKVTMSKTQ